MRSALGFDRIVGADPAMRQVFDMVEQVAPSKATVLITGESGTGKELFAHAVHDSSPRASRPFVKLHCASLAETLLESELFGHEKGSFTGASARREGRFKQADGGTLLLDEIGEISPATQVKLLRFLQEKRFERVGGNETLEVDVRIIGATNRDLAAEVASGRFRKDLYYRLNVVNIDVPPLRERASDVLPLAMHFLRRFATENERVLDGFADDALTRIRTYGWPGNVRELENVIERAVVLCSGRRVTARHLPCSEHLPDAAAMPGCRPKVPGSTLAEIERHAIMTTLAACGANTKNTARVLGVSTRTIQNKVHEYGLTVHKTLESKPAA